MTVASGVTTATTAPAGDCTEIGKRNQELDATPQTSKMQKAAVVGGIVLVLAAIAGLIVYFVHHSNAPQAQPITGTQRALTLESVLGGDFYARKGNATWISDNELMYKDEDGNIVTYNVDTKMSHVLIGVDTDGVPESYSYKLSADRKYMLISRNTQRIYRHSTVALYDAIDMVTKKRQPISLNLSQPQDYLLLAEWSPVGNAIVFVHANNIYYKPSVIAPAVQLTTDGSRSIMYGTCDWVYEEEVFASKTALWFSPDGKKLAFIRFDDTDVPVITIPVYGTPGALEFQYPQSIGFNYPKVNASNPIVSLFSVELTNVTAAAAGGRHEHPVPVALANEDHIISAVGWQNNETFVASWMNRVQNRSYIQGCNNQNCTVFKTIVSKTGWIELFKTLEFSKDGSQMVVILSQEQGMDGGYRHLTLVSTKDGRETPLTSGRFVVQSIEKWDELSNLIFYKANTELNAERLHLYAVKAAPGQFSTCLTCGVSVNGVNQTYFTASFSDNAQNLVLVNEGPSIPTVAVYKITISPNQTVSMAKTTVLETNDEIREHLQNTQVPNVIYLDVPLSTDGFTARVRLQLPQNADLSGKTKYPMLVDVYAGPDSFNGNDRWDLTWGSYLATNRSVIYAQINGRGSGLRGDRLMHTIFHKFGRVEVPDQIETAKKLSLRLPYIDGNRVAIWGWSYGGYTSAMALAYDDESVFKCAASVAPVTDWTLYDSIYTERFMGLPTKEDNAVGYSQSRLNTLSRMFRNKTFFLIHGTMDDNVHYQQSMLLARNLETNDVLFRQLSYPDEDHSLWSVRTHLYHSLGRYFAECFNMPHDL